MSYDKNKTVIVYLAMNTKKDLTYGRDSKSMLEKSLDFLYKNYNNQFKHDIIIFYDSKFPFNKTDQEEIKKGRNEITFMLINNDLWCPPNCLEIINNPNPQNWVSPTFSVGYRNMMRWFGILIYKFLTDLGYEWYMRLDDDSFIHSPINYDLFKFIYDNHYLYGFRVYSNDQLCVSNGLIEFCYDYCDKYNITPTFLNRFTLKNNSKTGNKYNILGYYNNFLITKLSFWMRDDVQSFLNEIDNSGYQYTRRWGDLVCQSVTIQIFMKRDQLFHFNDWCYEHSTISYDNFKYFISWGGLYPEIKNNSIVETNYNKGWVRKYGTYYNNTIDTYDIKSCLNIIDTDLLYSKLPLTSDFKPFENHNVYYLGEHNKIEDVYNTIVDHWLNCYVKIKRSIQFQYPNPKAFIWYNSAKHGYFYNKLYVINNLDIVCYDESNKATTFIVIKDFVVPN